MRRLFFAVLAGLSVSASAQSEFMKGDDLQAEIKRACDEGCVVLSPAEVEALQLAIVQKMAADLERAYQAGKDASDLVCRNKV